MDRMLDAYRDYVKSLSTAEQNLKIAILSYGVFTPRELIDHMRKKTKIGEAARRTFLEETRVELIEAGSRFPSDREVEAAAARGFKEAADARLHGVRRERHA